MRKIARLDMIGFDVSDDPSQNGNIAVRFRKLILDDDGRALTSEYHRAAFEPMSNEARDDLIERVQQDLERQGFERCPQWGIDQIKRQTTDLWTPEVRAAHARRREAQQRAEAQLGAGAEQ